jgi:hypothetical protein
MQENEKNQEPTSDGNEKDRRPTPVRMVMEGGDEEEKDGREQPRLIRDEVNEVDWIVTVTGRSVSGVLPLRTVPLMELTFAKALEPDRPLRRALRFDGVLEDIPDHELLSDLRGSEPYREPIQEPDGQEQGGKGRKNQRSSRD